MRKVMKTIAGVAIGLVAAPFVMVLAGVVVVLAGIAWGLGVERPRGPRADRLTEALDQLDSVRKMIAEERAKDGAA